MEIKTFWTIVLKGIGLWLLVEAFYILPQMGSVFSISNYGDGFDSYVLLVWLFSILVFVLYLFIVRLFLFKSEWLLNILKLEKNFTTDRIDIGISKSKVLKIIIVTTGALILVGGFPHLIREIYQFLRQKELIKDYSETSWLFFYFLKSIFGYLIMTNSRSIEKFISRESGN